MTNELVDVPALSAWLDEHIPSLGDGPLETAMIPAIEAARAKR